MVVALTVAVGPVPPGLASAFDLWTADVADAERWEKACRLTAR